MPSRRCVSCNAVKFKEHFAAGQFNREEKYASVKNVLVNRRRLEHLIAVTRAVSGRMQNHSRRRGCIRAVYAHGCVRLA